MWFGKYDTHTRANVLVMVLEWCDEVIWYRRVNQGEMTMSRRLTDSINKMGMGMEMGMEMEMKKEKEMEMEMEMEIGS